MKTSKLRIVAGIKRRIRRLIRTRLRPLVTSGPIVAQLVLCGPKGDNRGDAIMSLAIPQIIKRLCPDLKFVTCQISDIHADRPLVRDLGPCDMVIIGGGGLYGKWFSLDRLLGLRDLRVPIVLYALGLNVNYGDQGLPSEKVSAIRKLNRIATLSSVRDKMTQDFIRGLGMDACLIGDPGAFFDPGNIGHFVHRKSEFHVGLNLPSHSFTSQNEVLDRVIPIIYKVAQELSQAGAFLHYMLHDPKERNIIKRLQGLPLHVCEGGVLKLVRQYFGLDLMIGGMLHSNIFAFNAGVPFICLAYDKKHEAFLEHIDCQESYLRLADLSLNSLRIKIAKMRENMPIHRKALKATRDRLWKVHEAFARDVVKLIF